jgi:hypothetical protein
MAQTIFIFRIDIGFNTDKGYAATVLDVPQNRIKGIKAASPEQLISRIRNVFLEQMRQKRDFPLESEKEPSRIITPNGL